MPACSPLTWGASNSGGGRPQVRQGNRQVRTLSTQCLPPCTTLMPNGAGTACLRPTCSPVTWGDVRSYLTPHSCRTAQVRCGTGQHAVLSRGEPQTRTVGVPKECKQTANSAHSSRNASHLAPHSCQMVLALRASGQHAALSLGEMSALTLHPTHAGQHRRGVLQASMQSSHVGSLKLGRWASPREASDPTSQHTLHATPPTLHHTHAK
jgi:hypothetical protein